LEYFEIDYIGGVKAKEEKKNIKNMGCRIKLSEFLIFIVKFAHTPHPPLPVLSAKIPL